MSFDIAFVFDEVCQDNKHEISLRKFRRKSMAMAHFEKGGWDTFIY